MEKSETDGLKIYEYLVNHLDTLNDDQLSEVVDSLSGKDISAQYLASAARYLNAIDPVGYKEFIDRMVELIIERDREHRYIPELTAALYGADYAERADELSARDNNFRRLYKRLHPVNAM